MVVEDGWVTESEVGAGSGVDSAAKPVVEEDAIRTKANAGANAPTDRTRERAVGNTVAP